MDITTTFWFFGQVTHDNYCLIYNSNFSNNVTNKFIDLSVYNTKDNIKVSKIQRKISFLMVECFQNIVRHGEIKTSEEGRKKSPGFFMTKNIENTHFITSGNLVLKENIKKLTEQLRHVNSLSKDELRSLYKVVLSTHELSEKGGAGLGLIEIARKSGHKIDFSFKSFDDTHSFFYNQIIVRPTDIEDNSRGEDLFQLDESVEIHQKMNEHNILLIQKGDFSQESILPTLNIIEKNLLEHEGLYNKNKEVYHVLVELLQNISRHSLEINNRHEGIFLIGKTNDSIFVKAGNYIAIKNSGAFEERLKKVQTLTNEELRELYLGELKEGNKESKSAGIGLIDIARESKEPIKYNFQLIDRGKIFFTIHVTV